MATLINSTFSATAGTQLSAYTDALGTTYSAAGFASASSMLIEADGVQPNSANECAMLASKTSGSGNVVITGDFLATATLSGDPLAVSVWARVPNGATQFNGYYFSLNVGSHLFGVTCFVNGSGVNFGSNPDNTLAYATLPTNNVPADTYSYIWTLNGSSQNVVVQRSSDGNYLTSGGTWQVASATCISLTDTTYANGLFGLEFYGNPGNIYHGPFSVADYTGSPTPTPTPTTIPVNDSHLHFSGWNWVVNGSTYAQTNYRGASLKAAFTGTSLGVTFDVSPLTAASASSDQYPWIRYSVDDGPKTDVQLTSSTTTLSFASSLASGTHTLDLYVFSTNSFLDRWNTPSNVVRMTSLVLDSAATTAARSDLLPYTALFLGDSITEGDGVWGQGSGNTGTPPNNDATATWCQGVARALDAEACISGMGGQGWSLAAAGNPPGFLSAWQKIDANHVRSWTTPPTYTFVNMGTNGGNSGYSSGQLQTFLTAFRSAVGAATKLFIIIPFGQYNVASMTSDFNSYQSANTDPNLFLINLGTVGAQGLTWYGGTHPTFESFEGLHPNVFMHSKLAGLVSQATQAALSAGGTTGPGTTATTLTIDGTSGALANFECWVTRDSQGLLPVTGVQTTDVNGHVTFVLNTGVTYYLRGHGGGFQIGGTTGIPAVSFVA
jgi:hypothetical protein